MKRLAVLLVLAASVVLPPGNAGAAPSTVHVVDDDRLQCANAQHTSIQSAVDAASAGDLVKVCPGLYVERVVVQKPLIVSGQPDAVEAVDCFASSTSTLDDVDFTRHAVVQAPDTTLPDPEPEPLFRLDADGVELSGLVLQGAPGGASSVTFTPAVLTSDEHSGYWVHHNVIRLNTLGIEFGSSGAQLSRVDHNCLRENTYGLANQRLKLTNARVDHNATTRTQWFPYEIGLALAPVRDVVLDHNTSKEDGVPFRMENTTDVRISGNTVESARQGIRVVGVNTGLQLLGNTVTGSDFAGILFLPSDQSYPGLGQARGLVQGNTITGNLAGVSIGTDATTDTGGLNLEIADNVISFNRGSGLVMQKGNTRNVVRGNLVESNGNFTVDPPRGFGITLDGAVRNDVVDNRMFNNAKGDARDLAPGMNTWLGNHCENAEPASLCVGH